MKYLILKSKDNFLCGLDVYIMSKIYCSSERWTPRTVFLLSGGVYNIPLVNNKITHCKIKELQISYKLILDIQKLIKGNQERDLGKKEKLLGW